MGLHVMLETETVHVPESAREGLAGFRAWVGDNDLPEKARVDFYKGEVWVDMGREQLFTHGLLKTRISTILDTLAQQNSLGYYWCNGVLVTNEAADLSVNPDGTFVSNDALATERVKLVEGKEGGFVELEGAPDMVLEVVSDSSEKKDNQILVEAYWAAGIPEYWVVDGRGKDIEFTVFKRGARRYARAREHDGWVKSPVFGKEFRLTRAADPQGNPEFTLAVR